MGQEATKGRGWWGRGERRGDAKGGLGFHNIPQVVKDGAVSGGLSGGAVGGVWSGR